METKPLLRSGTIQGGIITLIVFVLQLLKVDLDEGIITELVITILALIGIIKVIIGRLKATTTIAGII